jgi:hypothetical protein
VGARPEPPSGVRLIPRVRLVYVQGLGAAHEDLRRPREVDLTTDGEALIVAPAASGRPLARLPLAAVAQAGVEPAAGNTTAGSRLEAGLSEKGDVLVLRFRAGPGVGSAVAEQPIVFASPPPGGAAAKLGAVEDLLRPRTPAEMARLARGERRQAVALGVGFVALVAFVLVVLVLLLLLVVAPRPRESASRGRPSQPAGQTTAL